MPAKPTRASGYSATHTGLAERVLLEVWSCLGEYRNYLVLIGGLAPRYIVNQEQDIDSHAGTMDVDLGISVAVAELKTYASIRKTLIEKMGFAPGLNDSGNEQRHSFIKQIDGVSVTIDFLTTKYEGPTRVIREVEQSLSAIQVEGLGLAFVDPLQITLSGELLSGGQTEQTIAVCRPLPYLILKILSFENRQEPKDSYDLIYVMKNCEGGAEGLAQSVRSEEYEAKSFQKALVQLRSHYRSPAWDGPVKYGSFIDDPGKAVEAYATVQEFLDNLEEM